MDDANNLIFKSKKKQYKLKVYEKKKYFKRKNNSYNYKMISLKLILISLLLFIFFYISFFFKTKSSDSKISKSSDSNITKSSDSKIIDISVLKPVMNKLLYWNNNTSLEVRKVKDEIKTYENSTISYDNPDDFIKRKNPKVSLIIAVYNEHEFIKEIYACILKQELKDIEIVFIDDASTDNSVNVIKELMEKDKRIVLLQNKENKKAFYSRNKGALNAKGEYVLIIDPDDYLINNILLKAYETASKYQLDILQFYMLVGHPTSPNLWRELKYKDGILIGNSEVRKVFYYTIGRNLVDKLVKREVFVKAIKFMKEELYNEDYELNDDDTTFFGLVHVANSYGFLEEIGYFYKAKKPGRYNSRLDPKRRNIVMKSVFNIMKYFYLQSDNNELEKRKMAYSYYDKSRNFISKYINEVTEGFDYFLEVLELYYNSTFYNEDEKRNINEIKQIIINRKNQIINLL